MMKTILLFITFVVAYLAIFAVADTVILNPNFNLNNLNDVHSSEIASLQSIVQSCNQTLQSLKSQQATIIAALNKQNAIITAQTATCNTNAATITTLNSDLTKLNDQLTAVNNQAKLDLALVQKMVDYLNQLSSSYSTQKAQIMPLLDAIKQRILDSINAAQALITQKNSDIAAANVVLTTCKKALADLQSQYNSILTTSKTPIDKAVTDQTALCNKDITDMNARLAQIKDEQNALQQILVVSEIPSGKPYAVSDFVANGLINTFDGLQFSVNTPGDYVFMRTWDNTLYIQGRVSNLGQLTAVALKLGDTLKISVEEDGTVFINGQQALLPVRSGLPSNVQVYSRYSDGGSAVEVLFTNGARVRIVSVSDGSAKDLLFAGPRTGGYWKNTVGLCGVFDDNKNDELLMSTHELILPTLATAAAYTRFIASWIVPTGQSLFINAPIKFTTPTSTVGITTLVANAAAFLVTYGPKSFPANVYCQATGDPHYTTFDGKYYDMYGVGDFLVLSDLSESFVIQARTIPWGAAAVNSVTGVSINGDVVQITAKTREVKVNGVVVYPDANGLKLAHGGIVFKYDANTFRVSHPAGAYINLQTYDSGSSSYQNQYIYLTTPQNWFDKLFGICGSFDNNANNDLTYNGKVYPDGHSLGKQAFALALRYTLFDITYNPPNVVIPITPQWKSAADQAKATTACKAKGFTGDQLDACLFDVWAFGDTIIADLAAQAAQNIISDINKYLNTTPSLYMPFDNLQSDVAIDLSNNHSNGKLVGNAEIFKYNLVLPLNGYVAAPNVARLTKSEGTITFWLQLANTGNPSNLISVGSSSSGAAYQLFSAPAGLSTTTRALGFTVGKYSIPMTSTIPVNSWQFISAVYSVDNKYISLYVNGQRMVLVQDISFSVPSISDAILMIGSTSIDCQIRDLRIFDFDLDIIQVNAIYHAGDTQYSQSLAQLLAAQQQLKVLNQTVCAGILSDKATCDGVTNGLVNNLNTQQSQIDSANVLLSQMKDALNKAIASNSSNADALSSSINQLSSQNKLCSQYQDQVNQLTPLSNEITLIQQIIDYVKQLDQSSETTDIVNMLSDLIKSTQKNIDSIKSGPQVQLGLCPSIIDQINKNITAAQSALSASSSLITRINTDINTQQNLINTMVSALNAIKGQITTQQAKCNTIAQSFNTVSASYALQLNTLQNNINTIMNMRNQGVY